MTLKYAAQAFSTFVVYPWFILLPAGSQHLDAASPASHQSIGKNPHGSGTDQWQLRHQVLRLCAKRERWRHQLCLERDFQHSDRRTGSVWGAQEGWRHAGNVAVETHSKTTSNDMFPFTCLFNGVIFTGKGVFLYIVLCKRQSIEIGNVVIHCMLLTTCIGVANYMYA